MINGKFLPEFTGTLLGFDDYVSMYISLLSYYILTAE